MTATRTIPESGREATIRTRTTSSTPRAWGTYFRIKFKYLLPTGDGRDEIIDVERLERGLPSPDASKAAIYYAAELRLIPNASPFDRWPWLQERLGVSWVQIVPFLEVGRVAPS